MRQQGRCQSLDEYTGRGTLWDLCSILSDSDIKVCVISSGAARQRSLGVYTLKELSENVESRNTVAFVKYTNFYHGI